MAPKAKDGAIGKQKRAPKAKKDPNAPKGASGPYIWFCNDKRPGIKAKNPSWGIGEIGKELGSVWKTLSDKDKEPYSARATKDKERYLKESAAYKKEHPDVVAGNSQKEKAKGAKEGKAAKKPSAKAAPKIASEEEDDDDLAEESEDDD